MEGSLKHLNRPALVKVLKIAVGSCLAIMIAQFFNVQYSASAGIITLLSIQDTKKATVRVAVKRALALIVAIGIAFLSFSLFGFTPYAFGIYLFLFAGTCIAAGLQDGIPMCSVLVTHFLIEKSMSPYWIKNEVLLMVIGAGIGIVLNLYMPRFTKQIRDAQAKIEWEIRIILKGLATFLADECSNFELSYDFAAIDAKVEAAIKQSIQDNDNMLFYDLRYFIIYMEMRKNQIAVLRQMLEQAEYMKSRPVQSAQVAALIDEILMTLRESNNARGLLTRLEDTRHHFRDSALPETRQEFEDRAILYGILNSIEQFLKFKEYFAANLTAEERKTFWSD